MAVTMNTYRVLVCKFGDKVHNHAIIEVNALDASAAAVVAVDKSSSMVHEVWELKLRNGSEH